MIFDTHVHYDDRQYDEDREILIFSLAEKGIGNVVNIGADMASSERALELAHKYGFIYAAVGVHPSEVEELNDEAMDRLKAWSVDERCVAIGEIGLDYHWPDPAPEIQKKWFVRQLDLAREVKLPVVIHSRDAAKDTMDIMHSEHAEDIGGVVHCFSYSKEIAMEYVKMGWYIGVGGVVTFKNAKKLVETVEAIPLESIVLETDCPYMAPVPHRGERNSSIFLSHVAEKIAEIKNISVAEVENVTYQNALNIYKKASR